MTTDLILVVPLEMQFTAAALFIVHTVNSLHVMIQQAYLDKANIAAHIGIFKPMNKLTHSIEEIGNSI